MTPQESFKESLANMAVDNVVPTDEALEIISRYLLDVITYGQAYLEILALHDVEPEKEKP